MLDGIPVTSRGLSAARASLRGRGDGAGVTAQTVRDWVMRFNENGSDGLIDF
jgi:transposase